MVGANNALALSRVPGGGGGVGGGGSGHSLPGPRYATGGAAAAGCPRAGWKTAEPRGSGISKTCSGNKA